MIQLTNECLAISIKTRGAELTKIKSLEYNIDYLWDGNPEYWGKHAPVLFPIVGTLKDNSYYYRDKGYSLPRHGFARDMDFELVEQSAVAASFELRSSEATLNNYPFHFLLRIHYLLEGNQLTNRYEVVNTGEDLLYFSIGGHPAFRVPFEPDFSYQDYYLEFEQPETAPRWTLQHNLVGTHAQPFLEKTQQIPLSHELFAKDAIVLKHLKSRYVSLRTLRSPHGLTMRIDKFPHFGIWASPDAPFVCLEPWQGIADSLYHNQKLEEKEGIVALEPGKVWSESWDVDFF